MSKKEGNKMKANLFIFLCIIPLTIYAQKTTKSEITDVLLNGNLDDFVNKYSKERAISMLLKYNLNDTISQREIWYGQSAIDTVWMQKNFLQNDIKFVSMKIKSIYWIWLIYNGDLQKSNESVGIVEHCLKVNLYDYEKFTPKYYTKVSANWILEVQNSLDAWGILFEIKGLKYLQEKKISPLNLKYEFRR